MNRHAKLVEDVHQMGDEVLEGHGEAVPRRNEVAGVNHALIGSVRQVNQ